MPDKEEHSCTTLFEVRARAYGKARRDLTLCLMHQTAETLKERPCLDEIRAFEHCVALWSTLDLSYP
jgi:hypothetical protein